MLRQRLKALGFGRIYISQVLPRLERKRLLVALRVGRKKLYQLSQRETKAAQSGDTPKE